MVDDVLLTVNVEVRAVLVILTNVGETAHVTGLVAPDGLDVTAQVSPTVPVKPLVGFTVMTEVLPLVAPAATVMFPLLVRVKPAVELVEPLTIAVIPTVWMYCPVESVPVITTLWFPLAAEEGAVRVTVTLALPPLVSVAEAGMEQVTPVAVQARLTAPAKPFTDVR